MKKIIDSLLKEEHYVTSPYGERGPITMPDGTVYPASFHYGTDYGTNREKIPVYAPCDITVTKVDKTTGAGNRLFATMPNGDKFKIQHLDSKKSKGDYKRGEQIAVVGTTGTYSTSVHIHLEVFVNDKNVDPETYDFVNAEITPEPTQEVTGNTATEVTNSKGEVYKVGDSVYPIVLKNYDGDSIKAWDSSYIISEFNRDNYERAVLTAPRYENGKKVMVVWAGVHIDNLKKK